jgi:hypothetical protein
MLASRSGYPAGQPSSGLTPDFTAVALPAHGIAGPPPLGGTAGGQIDWAALGRTVTRIGGGLLDFGTNAAKVGELPATAFLSALSYGGGMDPGEDARFRAGIAAADARKNYENSLIDSWAAESASSPGPRPGGAPPPAADTMGTPQGPDDPLLTLIKSFNHHGGPWTPRFRALAKDAGMSLDDLENQVEVDGHFGPHPQAYHEEVFDRLSHSTDGLTKGTPEYNAAFRQELRMIRAEASTSGARLNQMIAR